MKTADIYIPPVYENGTLCLFKLNETDGYADTLLFRSITTPSAANYTCGMFQGANKHFYVFLEVYQPQLTSALYEVDTNGTLLHIDSANTGRPYYVETGKYSADYSGNVYLSYVTSDNSQVDRTYLCKYNNNGMLLMDTMIGLAGSNAFLLAVDSAGNSYWQNDSVINKIDADLNTVYTYYITGLSEWKHTMDNQGNLYLIMTGIYGGGNNHSIKLRPDGTPAYNYSIPNAWFPYAIDINVLPTGDALINALSFYDQNTPTYNSNRQAVLLTVLDTAGHVKELFSDTVFYRMNKRTPDAHSFVTANGDVYMAADFVNTNSFNYFGNDSALNNMLNSLWYTIKICAVCGLNDVTGTVHVDTVLTCTFDSAAPVAQNAMVYLTPGTRASTVGNTGGYKFSQVPYGAYTVTVAPPPYLYSNCDSTFSFALDSLTPLAGYNFNLAPQAGCNMHLDMSGTRARAGYSQGTDISYYNHMFTLVRGMLAVSLDTLFSFQQSSQLPDSSSGNTYFWKFSNLQPYYPISISIYSLVSIIDSYQVSFFHLKAALYANCNSDTGILTSDTLTDFIYFAFDPNGKEVSPLINRNYNAFIDKSEPLTFQIDFQNTGNDTAIRIIVRDTIDPHFNIKSLQLLGSSSPCRLTIGPNRDVAFTFVNIQLPDSGTNRVGSQGYVKYRITSSDSLSLGQYVANRASIYFDFNNPVITNAVNLQYVSRYPTTVINIAHEDYTLNLYPNPATDQLYIKTENIQPQSITMYDVNGRMIFTQPFKPEIDINQLSNGVYFVEVQSNEGVARKRFVKM